MRLTASGSSAACFPPSTAKYTHELRRLAAAASALQLPAKAPVVSCGPLQEIYPGTKTRHFRAVHKASDIAYRDMLFFDNELRNVRDCAALGITSVYTPDGASPARGPALPPLRLEPRTILCMAAHACFISC